MNDFNFLTLIKKYFKYNIFEPRNRAISVIDITIFFRQFAMLIVSGIPIIQVCDLLEKSQEKAALRLLIYTIKRELLSGKNLSYGLELYPTYFDELTRQLILIGEHTGKLDVMLTAVANYQEKKFLFRKKIKQALFYPCVVTVTAFIITISLFVFIIPKFAELFSDKKEHLPLLTLFIFYLSAKLKQFFLLFIAILIFIPILILSPFASSLKKSCLQIFYDFPVIKPYTSKIILARFIRNLSITCNAGIPLLQSLKLSTGFTQHLTFTSTIAKLRYVVSTGMSLSSAMETLPFFPVLMIQMIKVGEESGALSHMLDKTADFLEAEIDQFFGQINQLLEPLLMIVLGVLIGGLVIGMYLPIFNLGYLAN